jgi:hypothetical protein
MLWGHSVVTHVIKPRTWLEGRICFGGSCFKNVGPFCMHVWMRMLYDRHKRALLEV